MINFNFDGLFWFIAVMYVGASFFLASLLGVKVRINLATLIVLIIDFLVIYIVYKRYNG